MTGEERENALHCLKVMIDEEVCEECKLYGTTGTDHCEADCVRVAIKALEQEPKTGKWISTETKGVRYAFWCRYKCSLCGELSDHTNFCPNCGAKMESEDKE